MSKEIGKREVLIAQLLAQSNSNLNNIAKFLFSNFFFFFLIFQTIDKELLNEKERQEVELQAQRLTLQEQRNHIDILDTALMSAQNNIFKLETEVI